MTDTHVTCPTCGQRINYMRAGARLPPLKMRLFDAIARGEPHGVRSNELIERLGLDIKVNCLRAHMWQINEIFERWGATKRIISRNHRWKIVPASK